MALEQRSESRAIRAPRHGLDKEALSHGGGPTWMTGTYDPELNLLYWGTGNPHPVLAGVAAPATIYTRAPSSPSMRTPASWSGISSLLPTTRTIGMRWRHRFCLTENSMANTVNC